MKEIDNDSEDFDKKDLTMNSRIIREELNKNNSISPNKISLSRKMRWIIFTILIFITILSDIDQGILSSSTSSLIIDFEMTERQLGGFGSMIFLGTALGCIFTFTLINKYNRKTLLLITISFDLISLFLTTKTSNLFLLYLYRVIAGFAQSFLIIYIPVWSDQFGIHKYKSIMLSIIHISSSFGYLFGYAMGSLWGWKNAFYVENILIFSQIVIIILFIPDKYFSKNLMPLKSKKESEQTKKEEEKTKDNIDIENIEEENNLIDQNINNDEIKKELKDEDNISLFEDIQTKEKEIKKESILNNLKILLKSKIFILMNITKSSMFIIVSAIQFWINDYMENGLLIEDEKKRLYTFAFVIITSPPSGIILGGIISGKIGGYDTEKAIYIPLIASFFDCILANIAPISTNLFIFLPLFWLYLFLGSILLPVVHGIILVSVDKEYAASASSISTLIFYFLGRLPGPNLYAFYKSIIGDKHSRIPFWLLLNMAFPAFFSVLFGVKYQKEKYRGSENKIDKIKELKEIVDENNNIDKNEMILEENHNNAFIEKENSENNKNN